jgi:hypothetical protein
MFRFNLKHSKMSDQKVIPEDDFLALNLYRNDIEKEINTYETLVDHIEKVDLDSIFEKTAWAYRNSSMNSSQSSIEREKEKETEEIK